MALFLFTERKSESPDHRLRQNRKQILFEIESSLLVTDYNGVFMTIRQMPSELHSQV